jgi:putative thiamine transport system permease protein
MASARRAGRADPLLRAMGAGAALLATGPVLLGLAGLALWSVAGPWPFPAAVPEHLDAGAWSRALPGLGRPLADTVAIAAASTALALALVIACLETETRLGRRPGAYARWLLFLPLLIPQAAFLFGLQVLGMASGLDGTRSAVAAAHLVFVLPYVYLALADAWHALDPRHAAIAATLGASRGRILAAVRLPLLLAPVLTAAAVGFSVSIGQYLATLLVGGGRVATLTTEAVALAAGGDRRLIGVYGLMQMLAPFAGFALALALPAIVWRNRRGLRGRP